MLGLALVRVPMARALVALPAKRALAETTFPPNRYENVTQALEKKHTDTHFKNKEKAHGPHV